MKNINTNILFYQTGYQYLGRKSYVDLVRASNIPTVLVEKIPGDTSHYLIKELDFVLLINAIQKLEEKKKSEPKIAIDAENEIDLTKRYEILLRLTETSSGEYVDLEKFDLVVDVAKEKEESYFHLCREIYTKTKHFSLGNIKVHTPPKDKDLCVLKVLIKLKNSKDEYWFIQSMHPIQMLLNDESY